MKKPCYSPIVLAVLFSPAMVNASVIDKSGFSIAAGTAFLGGEMGGIIKDDYSGSTFSAAFAIQYTTVRGVIFGGSYSPAVINTHQTQFNVSDKHIVMSQQRLKASLMTVYSGYQFDNGWRILAGAAQSDTAYTTDGFAFSEKQLDPMIGMGYQTPSGVHFDLHVTQVEYADEPATTLLIMMGTRI